MLRQFAMILKQAFRPSDPIARFQGDEFAVLLEGNEIESAKVAADRLRKTAISSGCHAGWEIPGVDLRIGLVEIEGSVDPGGVVNRADAAVAAVKCSPSKFG